MSLFRAAADKLPGVHNKEGQLVTDGFLDVCSLVVPVIGIFRIHNVTGADMHKHAKLCHPALVQQQLTEMLRAVLLQSSLGALSAW